MAGSVTYCALVVVVTRSCRIATAGRAEVGGMSGRVTVAVVQREKASGAIWGTANGARQVREGERNCGVMAATVGLGTM